MSNIYAFEDYKELLKENLKLQKEKFPNRNYSAQALAAASKIQKLIQKTVLFEVTHKQRAFKGNVVNIEIRSKTIGSAVSTDIKAFIAKTYLLARKQIPIAAKFQIWASCTYD